MPNQKTNQKKRERLYAEIADRISAYRASHQRRNPTRIFMSKPLYELLSGMKWEELPKDAKPMMFNVFVSIYDNSKMEYSFAEVTYQAEEVKA